MPSYKVPLDWPLTELRFSENTIGPKSETRVMSDWFMFSLCRLNTLKMSIKITRAFKI